MDFFRLLSDNDILRRYIVMNAFDGTLTSLGILIAMRLANVTDVRLILVSAIGVAFATGISGVWGAYLVEKAERKHELAELHKLNPHEDLDARRKEFKKLTYIMGLANGLSSFLVALIILVPYFLAAAGLFDVMDAFAYSLGIILLVLILIGSATAKIANEPLSKHALATIGAACFVGLVLLAFELLKFI
jgi:predicted membrane protein (TIGR00267 family)